MDHAATHDNPTVTRALSFHASWRCRHSGRCCSSNWPITLEASQTATIDAALATGRLLPVVGPAFADTSPDGTRLLGTHLNHCIFHDLHAGGGCRIQRTLGHDALPMACRQFPRIVVRHGPDVSITLSHYCPSASALLDDNSGPVRVVTAPRAFPSHAEYVGLTAANDLPPLLHPRCVFDWDSWWLFESRAVEMLGEQAWVGLSRLSRIVERLTRWTPTGEPLRDAVNRAFDLSQLDDCAAWGCSSQQSAQIRRRVCAAVPDAWHAQAEHALGTRATTEVSPVVAGRFLAAHAFANWTAYSGRGLRSWLRSVEAAATLLQATRDPGQVDLVLRHLCDWRDLVGT